MKVDMSYDDDLALEKSSTSCGGFISSNANLDVSEMRYKIACMFDLATQLQTAVC